ncbi:MAG TPA: alpha-galactosidase, partial [Candidatus Sumerlaeota bacterium]|nr:alpha-galactosidase [Candidatus Sumerlaeota bacterium]
MKPRLNWIAALAATLAGCLTHAAAAEALPPTTAPISFAQNLLKDTFVTPVPACRGWGKWDAPPFVFANSGKEAAVFQNGDISIPLRSISVHPGPDRDVAVGWQSPFSGKVDVRAKVTHAHPSGGDGVSWALILVRGASSRVLAQGVLDRAGERSIPDTAEAGKFAAVSVRQGDGLYLKIGRRETHFCDSTVIALTITDAGDRSRVWDLAKDVAADIQAANPHADSLGHDAVWHFFVPDPIADNALTAPRATADPRAKAWTLATEDTKLTVGVTTTGQLCVYELCNPAAGWNWTAEPSVLELPDQAETESCEQALSWTFVRGALDETDGQKLTLCFACASPSLELRSEWLAQPGRGPVHHVMRVTNRSDKPVTLHAPPTFHLDLAGPASEGVPTLWHFKTDGGYQMVDPQGVYREPVTNSFVRTILTNPDGPAGAAIPLAVIDSAGKHGLYVGTEWSYCRIAVAAAADWKTGALRVRSGEFAEFAIRVGPGETFETPPGFVGAYAGDIDAAGNSLRKHLFEHDVPEIVRRDTTYPKVQWNAFGATGDKPGGWNSVERKYYPLVDDIAPLGFEEVMLDVGWWKGDTSAAEPEGDPVDWASGMAKAAAYAHKAGLRFGLYWNKGEDMASPEGRNRRIAHIQRLYGEYKADMWRSDNTAGPVVGASYASVKGFYAMLDQLARELPNFQWENCSSGGRIKDYGALKRCVKIFNSDTYSELDVRKAFYDSSFALHPAQLEGHLGSVDGTLRPAGAAGMKFSFRSVSMGAPEWFIDAPNGGNGSAPWTQVEKDAITAAVATFKTKVRPLVRHADLYHIFPRPDGVGWDGVQYYDPQTRRGVVYVFKPTEGRESDVLHLRGLDPSATYAVTFEDGSNPAVEKTGAELAKGLELTLKGAPISELMFLDERRRPSDKKLASGAELPVEPYSSRPTDGEMAFVTQWKQFLLRQGEARDGRYVADLPFSFRCGDRSSREWVSIKTANIESGPWQNDKTRTHVLRWKDGQTSLVCEMTLTEFQDLPAFQWVVRVRNDGPTDSAKVHDFWGIDTRWHAADGSMPILHRSIGSPGHEDDFHLMDEVMHRSMWDKRRRIAMDTPSNAAWAQELSYNLPRDQRSSAIWLPFFNYQTGNDGLIVALGWSGAWRAYFDHQGEGKSTILAGVENFDSVLHPGETVRSTLNLVLYWKGEMLHGQNMFRQLVLEHASPRINGTLIEPPISGVVWGGIPSKEHLEIIDKIKEYDIPLDVYWFDAGWYGTGVVPSYSVFEGDWGIMAGDWRPNPNWHNGTLKPVSDAAHAAGMKFLVWVEPCRALHGRPITLEHPEYFLTGNADGKIRDGQTLLLDLGKPDSQKWAIDVVANLVHTYNIDWYEEDFNIEPNPYLETAAEPGRWGMNEMRFIEGHFAFWDALRKQFPHLAILNCASGGRRIDLESISRGQPLWRSDYNCFSEATDESTQDQSYGIL